MNFKGNVFFISLLMLISGCSDLDYNNAKPADKPLTVQAIDSNLFTVELKTFPEPNHYAVLIHVPENSAQKSVVRRTSNVTKESTVLELSDSLALADENLSPNTAYSYELGSFEAGKFNSIAARTLTIPADLVVSTILSFDPTSQSSNNLDATKSRKLEYGRLFLKPNSSIRTFGENVTFNVTEIVSENGRIQTYPSDNQAPANQRGHSGGSLTITADKLTGPIEIIMRGQTGGSGNPGIPGAEVGPDGSALATDGTPGTQGAPGGDSGRLHLKIKNFKAEELKISVLGGLGGPGGGGGKNGEGHGGGYAPNGATGYPGDIEEQDIN